MNIDGWKNHEFSQLVTLVKDKHDCSRSVQNYSCIELEHLGQENGRLLSFIDSTKQASIKNKFKKGDVLFGKLRPYLRKYWLANFDGVCSTEIWVFRANRINCVKEYLFYLVQSHKFIQATRVSSGSKMPRADWDWVSEFVATLPPLPEQKKIGEILSTWDKAIETCEKLISAKQMRKRALMQRFLTGKQRFPQFRGQAWEEVKLSDVFERVTRKNDEGNTNVVTISAQRGFVRQNDFFKKIVASDILDNYFLVKKGEFCYNKSYSNGYPWGATKRLKDFDKAVVTTLYICFKFNDETKHSGDFFEHFFEAGLLDKGLTKIAHEGGRAHGLLNVTPSDFFNLKITIPTHTEQTAVAQVLQSIHKEVDLLKKQLAALKNQKRGLMQKLMTGKVRVTTQ